jgi:hypothetical protein
MLDVTKEFTKKRLDALVQEVRENFKQDNKPSFQVHTMDVDWGIQIEITGDHIDRPDHEYLRQVMDEFHLKKIEIYSGRQVQQDEVDLVIQMSIYPPDHYDVEEGEQCYLER